MAKEEMIVHPIPPLYDSRSKILILGSFPSPKSREAAFFYGHPQNRFWRVMAEVLDWKRDAETGLATVPQTVPEKRDMLLSSGIALWDTIASCRITGASDASIKDVTPNDLSGILDAAEIRKICCNGAKSHSLYMKYIYPVTGRKAERLPSTSPANAAASLERLIEEWRRVLFGSVSLS